MPYTVLSNYFDDHVTATWIMLKPPKHNPITLCVLYHPPNLSKTQKSATIEHIISTTAKLSSRFTTSKLMLVGDFNDLDTSPLTLLLPLKQLVEFPTRGKNKLDLVFTDIEEYASGCEQLPPILNNDHCAISLSPAGYKTQSTYRTIHKHDISPAAKVALTEELAKVNWDFILKEKSVDEKVQLLQSFLCDLYNKHCPVRSIRVPACKPCVTSALIRKLQRAKKRAHKNRNSAWKSISGLLKFHQKQLSQKHVNSDVNFAIKGSKTWWNNVKSLLGESISKRHNNLTFIDDRWISCAEFTEEMNKFLLSFSKPVSFRPIDTAENDIPKVEEYEVYHYLTNIDTKKSTISDDYPSWITKHNADILSEPVADIINSILSESIFPSLWKRAEVIPVPKLKNPSLCKDFRPISLLFHLSKITEKVISHKIKREMPTLSHQYAYTSWRGVEDALVLFMSELTKCLDDPSTLAVRALLLDFTKAFDRMPPDVAVERLSQLGVNKHLVRLIQSFFTGREQCVKFGDSMSSFSSLTTGVPQGTVLGPLLWNAFINHLDPPCKHFKYADDISIYSVIKKSDVTLTDSTSHQATVTSFLVDQLQESACYAQEFCQSNDLSLNINKSCTMTFTLQKELTLPKITIGGSEVSECPSSRLLGVQFDKHLRFSGHVSKLLERTKTSTFALTLLRKSGVDSTSIALFYKARILSVLSFACPVWYPYLSRNDIDKLESFQSLCTRIILPFIDDYDERLSQLNIEELSVHLNVLCLKYVSKVQSYDDHVCRELLELSHKVGRTSFYDKLLFKKFI